MGSLSCIMGKQSVLKLTLVPFPLIALLFVLATACGTSTPAEGVGDQVQGQGEQAINSAWLVPPSIDQQIFDSNAIIRATLASATAGTETVSGGYLPIQTLRFTVHEFLKGSGTVGSQIEVVVRGHSYFKKEDAQKEADRALSQRNTAWDGRQGILFLENLGSGGASGSSAQKYEFTLSNPVVQSPWDYSIDSLSRAWLPDKNAGAAGQSSATQVFNSKSPTSQISLADLKAKIAAQKSELDKGAGTAGYRECVYSKILKERHRRAEPWTPSRKTVTGTSGSAAGTQVWSVQFSVPEPKYHVYWLSGPDASLFQAPIVDNDTNPSNGYHRTLAIARPLPAGTYRVHHNWQHYEEIPCNFRPTDVYRDITVTVTAPTGTVHEAFFDPASTSLGVGFQGSQGTLSPASFTHGSTTVTISRITWSFGSVSMVLSPSVSLSGKHVEFIKTDGTLAAKLSIDRGDLGGGGGIGFSSEENPEAAAAQAQAQAAGAKFLFWLAPSAPWKAGDKLMIRIR